MTALLDVNVLIALAWPNHIHHHAARTWFEEHGASDWATCSITENGFVRISANPKIMDEARTPQEAILMLRQLTLVGRHRFLNDDVSIGRAEDAEIECIRGHRQVLDAHLLRLAHRHSGRLATFDRKVGSLLRSESERDRHLVVLG